MPPHAAAQLDSPPEDAPASAFEETLTLPGLPDRFLLLRPLGQGGQAETFLARDAHTQQLVVVKRLALARAEDWKSVELFEREARVLAQLSHPSIPGSVHAGVHDRPDGPPSFVLVHQYVEGKTLASVLEDGVIDEQLARTIARDVLDVLVYLQGRRPPVVHRDIKPSNLVLRPDGGVSVIDFGALQSVVRSASTVGSTIIGTPGFVAPEQIMGRAIPASDLYSLGATLVQLLSGLHPSELPSRGMRIDFSKHVDVSAPFVGFLGRLLAPSVDERFTHAAEALASLSTLPNGGAATRTFRAVGPASSQLTVRPAYKTRVLAVVGTACISLLAILWATGVHELAQARGELHIDTSGPAALDARVYVDDALVCDRMPCYAGMTKTGHHQIRVEAVGQAPRVRDVTVDADTTTVVHFGH